MKLFVQSNLTHNGKSYAPGEKVDLTDDQAANLLSAGVVSETKVALPEIEPETVTVSTPVEPEVGGAPQQTGEPSLDSEAPKTDDTATDVTPDVDLSENL